MSMRIVIKPAGAVLMILALGLIAFLITRGKPLLNSAATPSLTVAGESVLAPIVADAPAESRWYLVAAKSRPSGETGNGTVHAELSAQLPAKPWSNIMIQEIKAPLKSGERLAFRGFVRSSKPRMISVFAEEATSPHGKILTCQTTVSQEWSEFKAVGTAKRDFPVGEARLVVHMGGETGFVEVREFSLTRDDAPPTQ